MAAQAGLGPPRSKREPIEVAERKPEDKSLDKLLNVRKQRIDRFERERKEAREAWRESRRALREVKQQRRDAVQAAKDFWQQARAEFFGMTITTGQYKKAKAIYERMKEQAAQLYLQCREAVVECERVRAEFFAARLRAMQAHMQTEKLSILRDEIRALNQQSEA